MLNILFVDDEPNIIQGLRRMLHSMRNEWKMKFVESGEEALKFLSAEQVDILITDMRMPKMDGARLLTIVREKYPRVVRIILSGYSEKEFIMKTSSTAHQFLAKPCSMETLKNTIKRIQNLRTLVCSEELKEKVVGLSNLPSLPNLYKKLDDELKSANVSLKNIGNIISHDITMTAKILQMVNSAFFGLPQKINDPIQAANFLGMDTIKSLILFHQLFSVFEKDNSIQDYLKTIWEHSFKVGILSKKMMALKFNENNIIEQAFVAGLLHDIGKVILIQMPAYQEKVKEFNMMSGREIRLIEQSLFGTDHGMVGSYLLGLWGLPDFVVESAAFHHSPSAMGDEQFSVLSAVHISHMKSEGENLDQDYLESIGVLDELEKFSEIVENIEELQYE